MAGGAPRVLLADEVGLGKTIQAGWIIADLIAREPSSRILVAVPAGLRRQWRAELSAWFEIAAIAADARWLRGMVADLPADVSPWAAPGVYLGSVDFLKRTDVAASLEATRVGPADRRRGAYRDVADRALRGPRGGRGAGTPGGDHHGHAVFRRHGQLRVARVPGRERRRGAAAHVPALARGCRRSAAPAAPVRRRPHHEGRRPAAAAARALQPRGLARGAGQRRGGATGRHDSAQARAVVAGGRRAIAAAPPRPAALARGGRARRGSSPCSTKNERLGTTCRTPHSPLRAWPTRRSSSGG